MLKNTDDLDKNSTLQHVTLCFSVLQCVAWFVAVRVAVLCSVLQCMLQWVAVCVAVCVVVRIAMC